MLLGLRALLAGAFAALALAGGVAAQSAPAPVPATTKQAMRPAANLAATPTVKRGSAVPIFEPRALDLLKASAAKVAAARSMSFSAVTSFERPSRLGPELLYLVRSEVLMQRPNRLRVITLGDGPASEFYLDGKVMTAFSPGENLVAVADAPPTIDAALQTALQSAGIYFAFTDLIVADPYKNLSDGLKEAFYIGQSRVVGGTTTDIVAYVTGGVFAQMWIGADDKLPRRLRAVFLDDPLRLRYDLELSDWKLDVAVPDDAFMSTRSAAAQPIVFAHPVVGDPPGKPAAKRRAAAKTVPGK